MVFRSDVLPEGRSREKQEHALSKLPLWKVARAIAASPPYLSPMRVGEQRFVDGAAGGFANPIELAYKEVRRAQPRHQPRMLISIGTDFEPSVSDRCHENFTRDLASINNSCTGEGAVIYHRFKIPVRRSLDPSTAETNGSDEDKDRNDKSIESKIETAVSSYVLAQDAELETCARELVKVRRSRQTRLNGSCSRPGDEIFQQGEPDPSHPPRNCNRVAASAQPAP